MSRPPTLCRSSGPSSGACADVARGHAGGQRRRGLLEADRANEVGWVFWPESGQILSMSSHIWLNPGRISSESAELGSRWFVSPIRAELGPESTISGASSGEIFISEIRRSGPGVGPARWAAFEAAPLSVRSFVTERPLRVGVWTRRSISARAAQNLEQGSFGRSFRDTAGKGSNRAKQWSERARCCGIDPGLLEPVDTWQHSARSWRARLSFCRNETKLIESSPGLADSSQNA